MTIGNGQRAFISIAFTVEQFYQQMFLLPIKEEIQILNGNNIVFRMK